MDEMGCTQNSTHFRKKNTSARRVLAAGSSQQYLLPVGQTGCSSPASMSRTPQNEPLTLQAHDEHGMERCPGSFILRKILQLFLSSYDNALTASS